MNEAILIIPPPSRWTVTVNDRDQSDPSQAEIRQRIDQVWRLKAANGGTFPDSDPEAARRARYIAQFRLMRTIVFALPTDGSEVRQSNLLRSLQMGELTVKRAVELLSEAGIVETRFIAGRNVRVYRRTVPGPVPDGAILLIARRSICGPEGVAA